MEKEIILICSLIPLLMAPVLYSVLLRRPRTRAVFEKVLYLLISLVVMIHIIPESWELSGVAGLFAAVLGWWIPRMAERSWHIIADRVHRLSLIILAAGIIFHGLLDGAGLASPIDTDHVLGWSIVLHHIPMALFVWWLLFPHYGWLWPTFLLSLLALSVVGGFAAGSHLTSLLRDFWIGIFQAFVAGTLIHLTVHRDLHSGHDHNH